jgi:Kef-type K+ transport system membrane component KefB
VDNLWLVSSLWIGLALLASLISIRVGVSVALIEIIVGVFGGNLLGLTINPWVSYLAGVGSIVLTFLAGAEIDPEVVRKHFWPSMSIGLVGFFAPFFGVLAYAHYAAGWNWQQAEIAGLALSTTSMAVVYAVMLETGFNKTEMGKVILAACFVNDLGTVLGLGVLFANYNIWLVLFAVVTGLAIWLLPKFVPTIFRTLNGRVSEPETKLILLVLFFLGGLGNLAKSEAVLPAYLARAVLSEGPSIGSEAQGDGVYAAHPVLLPEGRLACEVRVGCDRHRDDSGFPVGKDGDQVRGNLAAHQEI